MPKIVSSNVYDKTKHKHLGIIKFPILLLKDNTNIPKTIHEKFYKPDFSDLTQGCKTACHLVFKRSKTQKVTGLKIA